jgi:hypothetical protein
MRAETALFDTLLSIPDTGGLAKPRKPVILMNYSYIEVKAEILEQCRNTHTHTYAHTNKEFLLSTR